MRKSARDFIEKSAYFSDFSSSGFCLSIIFRTFAR